ncbi:MAG: hydrolase [Acidiferrobacterales bacterium]
MSGYTPYLKWIDDEHAVMVQMLFDWSAINSGSYNLAGLGRMRQALISAFRPLQGTIEEIDLAPMEMVDGDGKVLQVPLGKALRITRRLEARHHVFLGGHMDTVFGSDHPFQKTVWRDKHSLNGPGVADLKGGLVVMLKVLEALERSPYAETVGWEVLINPDEEIGSPGSAPLLEASARRNQFGLIYEPALSDGTLAGARKGSGNFVAVIRGKAAHAGREHHLGHNAVVALADFIRAIDALNGKQPGITVNPGKIEGGGPVNIVPDLAICRFNIRVATVDEQAWVENQLQAICEQINQREGYKLELHGDFGRTPKALTPESQTLFETIAACGKDLGLSIEWKPTGGCCDGNNLAAAGLPNVDTLGVRGGHIHSADEFVLVDSLTERARLSALLLMKLGAGELVSPKEWTGTAV